MFDAATQELDRILARLLRNDPVLRLERESATNWIVVDAANQDAVMLRTPSLKTIDRFVQAFLTKHPEATFTSSGEPMRGSELPSAGAASRPAEPVPLGAVPEGSDPASPDFLEAFAQATQHLLAIASQDAYSLKVPDAPMAEVIQLRAKGA